MWLYSFFCQETVPTESTISVIPLKKNWVVSLQTDTHKGNDY